MEISLEIDWNVSLETKNESPSSHPPKERFQHSTTLGCFSTNTAI
jgi:hypothetical protein